MSNVVNRFFSSLRETDKHRTTREQLFIAAPSKIEDGGENWLAWKELWPSAFLSVFVTRLTPDKITSQVKPRSRKQILRRNKGKGKKVNEVFD